MGLLRNLSNEVMLVELQKVCTRCALSRHSYEIVLYRKEILVCTTGWENHDWQSVPKE